MWEAWTTSSLPWPGPWKHYPFSPASENKGCTNPPQTRATLGALPPLGEPRHKAAARSARGNMSVVSVHPAAISHPSKSSATISHPRGSTHLTTARSPQPRHTPPPARAARPNGSRVPQPREPGSPLTEASKCKWHKRHFSCHGIWPVVVCGGGRLGASPSNPPVCLPHWNTNSERTEGLTRSAPSARTCKRSLGLAPTGDGNESKQRQLCKVPGSLEAAVTGDARHRAHACGNTLRPTAWAVEGAPWSL